MNILKQKEKKRWKRQQKNALRYLQRKAAAQAIANGLAQQDRFPNEIIVSRYGFKRGIWKA